MSRQVTGQRTTISVRVGPETLSVIDARAASEFCSRGEAARMVIDDAVQSGGTVERSAAAELKEREAFLKVADLEREAARKAGLLCWTEDVHGLVEYALGDVRSHSLAFLADLARETNSDMRTLQARYLAAISRASVDQAAIAQLADKCASDKAAP